MSDTVVIGIGDYVSIKGNTKISTVGLGSCIGTVLYDKNNEVSGMSHIMLPNMGNKEDRLGKYADAAIPALIDDMVKNEKTNRDLIDTSVNLFDMMKK